MKSAWDQEIEAIAADRKKKRKPHTYTAIVIYY
jgi:hypothetical protein